MMGARADGGRPRPVRGAKAGGRVVRGDIFFDFSPGITQGHYEPGGLI